MRTVKMPIALTASFLWIGFVCAISFMEAWLKFRAPGVTIPLGLGIGRLVFNALNKVEWIFATAILGNILFTKSRLFSIRNLLFFIPSLLLFVQTTWILPLLDTRAELHIQNQIVPPSNLHFYFVVIEILKVICLALFGFKLFKKISK